MDIIHVYEDFIKTLKENFPSIVLSERDEMLLSMAVNHTFLSLKDRGKRMNVLLIQDLFHRILADLEYAEDQLYNDEEGTSMKNHCTSKRNNYMEEIRKYLMQQGDIRS